jgi:hypothetical protein
MERFILVLINLLIFTTPTLGQVSLKIISFRMDEKRRSTVDESKKHTLRDSQEK